MNAPKRGGSRPNPGAGPLARCQHFLQQGRFVADLLRNRRRRVYPATSPERHSFLRYPTGFDYDVVPPEVVLQRMNCNNAQFILPDAMSYRVLVLPQVNTMTPQLLGKIKALIQAGGTVIGPKPVKSPSLSNFPACDLEVAKLAGEIWGDCDGKKVKEHSLGAGKIVWGKSLEQTLSEMKVLARFRAGNTHDSVCTKPHPSIHRYSGFVFRGQFECSSGQGRMCL